MHPLIRFPGIRQIESASITLGHGITPGVFQITIAPQDQRVETFGTLEIVFGAVRIQFRECQVDSSSVRYGGSGGLVSLNIVDRRWKWQFGAISGSYNLRNDDFSIRAGTEKSPRELARLCLEAMGEVGYDVAALPNDARPTVEWEGENPAQALANLCDELGCRIVLRLGGRVRICQAGVGANLPAGPIIELQNADDPAERPDGITILCGRNRYQCDFELEAVGLDADGSIRPLDELSYKPTGGWGSIDLPDMQSIADRSLHQLAERTVFRWYRIKCADDHPIDLPGYGLIRNLWQILPIESEQVDTRVIDEVVTNKPAQVYGVWHGLNLGNDNNTADAISPLGADDNEMAAPAFVIDETRGIVEFAEPVVRIVSSTLPIYFDAVLRLRTAVSVRDPQTRAWVRYERSRPSRFRRLGTRHRTIRHDEIVLAHSPFYRLDFGDYRVFDNRPAVHREADYYLDAAEKEYEPKLPASVLYAGIVRVEPDGAIQTIEWSIGPQGATTRVCRNLDQGTATTIPYRIQRANERLRGVANANKQQQPQLLRRNVQKAKG